VFDVHDGMVPTKLFPGCAPFTSCACRDMSLTMSVGSRYSADFFDGKHQVVVGFSRLDVLFLILTRTNPARRVLRDHSTARRAEDTQKLLATQLPLRLGGWTDRVRRLRWMTGLLSSTPLQSRCSCTLCLRPDDDSSMSIANK
jgi:hypothetical protein